MQLNPMHLKVSGLLNNRLFRIPDYQRAYAWGTKQRDDLFHDIEEVRKSDREHFMATVVALARETRSIGADEFRTVELVDGQQRITTLIILLTAIQKALSSDVVSEAKVKRELRELLVKGDDHTVLLLQTNHESTDIFPKYLRSGKIDKTLAVTAADANLADAMTECEAFVSKWCKVSDLITLVSCLRNRLSMIYHELADEATVYRVFEVLNSRGLDVKHVDKLKSQLMALIFEHVESGSRAEALGSMQLIWKNIYRKLGLQSDLGDEALRFAGTWAMVSPPSKIANEALAAERLSEVAGNDLKTITAIGERLSDVVTAVHALYSNARLGAVTAIIHARFVATAILLRKFNPKIQSALIGEWERITFRIFGLGDADTRNKRGDYVKLGYDILNKGLTEQVIAARITGLGESFRIREIIAKPGYWGDCYNGWSEQLRYLLFRYDEHLAKQAGENLNETQWNKVWQDDPSKSIEHIKPQSSEKPYVHQLGNLCMLPPGVNSSLRDRPAAEKAATYRSCGLRATALVGQQINEGKQWNEQAVRARTAAIEAFVLAEWAEPDSEIP